MLFPKIEVAWSRKFNDTGLDWMKDLQPRFIALVESKRVLHELPKDLHSWTQAVMSHMCHEENINGVPCRLYVEFDTAELHINCYAFCIKPFMVEPTDNDIE